MTTSGNSPCSTGRVQPGVPVLFVDPVAGEYSPYGETCLELDADPVDLMTGDDVPASAVAE